MLAPFSVARFAPAPRWPPLNLPCIFLVIWMPLRAMRRKHSLDAPAYILAGRYWLQMRWVNAQGYTAKMVKLEPLGDGANEKFVSVAVCIGAVDPSIPIAGVDSANPDPAAVRFAHPGQQFLLIGFGYGFIGAVTVEAVVVRDANCPVAVCQLLASLNRAFPRRVS